MAFTSSPLKISDPVHREITAIKFELEQAARRRVTYSETLEELARSWRATQALVRDARAAGQ
jgi:hypothetical protein